MPDLHHLFFGSIILPKHENFKIGIVCCNILIFWKRVAKFWGKFSWHLDYAFNLVAVFLTFFFLLFRQVLKTSCHLMLNLSLDATQRCNIWKKIHWFGHVSSVRPGTQMTNKRLLSDDPDLQFSFGGLVLWNPWCMKDTRHGHDEPAHHPLDAQCHIVMDEPQLS